MCVSQPVFSFYYGAASRLMSRYRGSTHLFSGRFVLSDCNIDVDHIIKVHTVRMYMYTFDTHCMPKSVAESFNLCDGLKTRLVTFLH